MIMLQVSASIIEIQYLHITGKLQRDKAAGMTRVPEPTLVQLSIPTLYYLLFPGKPSFKGI